MYPGTQGAVRRIVDVQPTAWHSRWMRDRYSVCRLLLTLALSQAMVIQALLVVWSGAQAAAGVAGGVSAICSGKITPGRTEPGQPSAPHDCFSACLAGQIAAPPDRMVLRTHATAYERMSASRQLALPEIERQLAFSARSPPKLT